MAKRIKTHYLNFTILLPLSCLLPPYDTDEKFQNQIGLEVFYHTQFPDKAEMYDYRVNPIVAEMLYWPEVNLHVSDAVLHNCESFWEERRRLKQSKN